MTLLPRLEPFVGCHGRKMHARLGLAASFPCPSVPFTALDRLPPPLTITPQAARTAPAPASSPPDATAPCAGARAARAAAAAYATARAIACSATRRACRAGPGFRTPPAD